MTDSDFRLALSIALAINAGRDPIGSVQHQLNLLAEALVWVTLPESIEEKTVRLTASRMG